MFPKNIHFLVLSQNLDLNLTLPRIQISKNAHALVGRITIYTKLIINFPSKMHKHCSIHIRIWMLKDIYKPIPQTLYIKLRNPPHAHTLLDTYENTPYKTAHTCKLPSRMLDMFWEYSVLGIHTKLFVILNYPPEMHINCSIHSRT